MDRIETAHGTVTFRSPGTDRAVIRHHDGHTVFGRFEIDNGIERFVVAHYPRSRTYKTESGASRAAAKWVAA